MRARSRLTFALVTGGGLLVAGCSGSGSSDTAASPSAPAATASSPTSPSLTPTPSPITRRKLKPGAKGDDVRALQQRLKDLHYDPGKPDGKYGPTLQMAVWAFEKVNGLKVTGTLGKKFWAALDAPKEPVPLAKKREADRVDVDLRKQYLVVYKGGQVALISHISSGGGYYYCAKDPGAKVPRCRYATTSTGDFVTGRRYRGWENGPLGHLYNPIYFNGGIAFHGYPSVPDYPASHGCVRVPMHVADRLPKLLNGSVPVHVRRSKP